MRAVAAACLVNFADPESCCEEDFGGRVDAVLQALRLLIQAPGSPHVR